MTSQGQPPKGGPGAVRPSPLSSLEVFGAPQDSTSLLRTPAGTPSVQKVLMGYKMIPQLTDPTTLPMRARMVNFYNKYNPEKIGQVDELLEKYKGHEDAVISGLVSKYGPEPPAMVPTKTPVWGASPSLATFDLLSMTQGTSASTTSPAPHSPQKKKMMKKRPHSLASTMNGPAALGETTQALLDGSLGTFNRASPKLAMGAPDFNSTVNNPSAASTSSPPLSPSPSKRPTSFRKRPPSFARTKSKSSVSRSASQSALVPTPSGAGGAPTVATAVASRRKLLSEFKMHDSDDSSSSEEEDTPAVKAGVPGPQATNAPSLPVTPGSVAGSSSVSFAPVTSAPVSPLVVKSEGKPTRSPAEDAFAAQIRALGGAHNISVGSASSSETITHQGSHLPPRRGSPTPSVVSSNNTNTRAPQSTSAPSISSTLDRRTMSDRVAPSSLATPTLVGQPTAGSTYAPLSATDGSQSNHPSSRNTVAPSSREEGDAPVILGETDTYAPSSVNSARGEPPRGRGRPLSPPRSQTKVPQYVVNVPNLNLNKALDRNVGEVDASRSGVPASAKTSQINLLRQSTPERRSGGTITTTTAPTTAVPTNRYGVPSSPVGPTPAPLQPYRRPSPLHGRSPEPKAPMSRTNSGASTPAHNANNFHNRRPSPTAFNHRSSSVASSGKPPQSSTTHKTTAGNVVTVIDRRAYTPNIREPFPEERSGGRSSRVGSMGPPYQSPSRNSTPSRRHSFATSSSSMSLKEIAAREHRAIVKLDIMGRGHEGKTKDGVVASTFIIKDKDRPSAWAREPLRKDFVAKMQERYGDVSAGTGGEFAFDKKKVIRATLSEVEVDAGIDRETGLRSTNIYRGDRVIRVLKEVPVGPEAVKYQEQVAHRLSHPRPLFVSRDTVID